MARLQVRSALFVPDQIGIETNRAYEPLSDKLIWVTTSSQARSSRAGS